LQCHTNYVSVHFVLRFYPFLMCVLETIIVTIPNNLITTIIVSNIMQGIVTIIVFNSVLSE
jgi:hypothetical protein